MWSDGGLVYIWRPVTGGRHAFPARARNSPHEETITSYCGVEVEARELHAAGELDWILKPTCMACWHVLATPHAADHSRPHASPRRRHPGSPTQ